LIISPLAFLPLVRGKEIKVINMLKVITSGRRGGRRGVPVRSECMQLLATTTR